MSGKTIGSIFLISLAGVVIWLVGFVVIILLNLQNTTSVSRTWLVIMFVSTIFTSVVKNIKKTER